MVSLETATEVVFRCATCHVVVTLPLRSLSDRALLCETAGEDYVPRGWMLKSDGSFFTGTEGQFIVNLKDLINTKHHSDPRRLNGCCGLDGCDGKNTICKNGHELGTERSDCWIAHAILLDPSAIETVVVE